MQQEIDDQKQVTKDVRDSLNKTMKEFLALKMSNKFLKTAERHSSKSQADHDKNMEKFNVER